MAISGYIGFMGFIATFTTGTVIATAQFQEALSETDENYLEEAMGEENYETLVWGYYIFSGVLTLGASSIPKMKSI